MAIDQKDRAESSVVLIYDLGIIKCKACEEETPLSPATRRNPFRVSEELAMARELHADCYGLNPKQAAVRRKWREGWLREEHSRPWEGDRLVYSV